MKWNISLPSKLLVPSENFYKDTTFSRITIITAQLLWDSVIPPSFLFTNRGLSSSLSFISCASIPSSGRDQQVCFRKTEALPVQQPCTVLEPQHWLITRQDEAQSKRQRKISPVGGHVLGMSSSSLPEILSFVSPCFPQGHKSALN